MDSVNKTLYIPLYGKSKSKWLAYYMAMRVAVYDEWVREEIRKNPAAIVMHIGCGMDSRIRRMAQIFYRGN